LKIGKKKKEKEKDEEKKKKKIRQNKNKKKRQKKSTFHGMHKSTQMNKEKKAWELYDVYPKPLKRLLMEMVEHSFRGCFICLSVVHHHFKFRNHSSLSSCTFAISNNKTNSHILQQPLSQTAYLLSNPSRS
jgi:hypothetical protein